MSIRDITISRLGEHFLAKYPEIVTCGQGYPGHGQYSFIMRLPKVSLYLKELFPTYVRLVNWKVTVERDTGENLSYHMPNKFQSIRLMHRILQCNSL